MKREHILLRAAYQLLKQQNESHVVLNMLEQTTVWDEATCDGHCLLEEAEGLLRDAGVDPDFVGECDHGM